MSNDIPGHFPNMVEHGPIAGNGLICWRDKERPCGPECMAFTEAPEGPDYAGKQWASCSLLVYEHRGAKHLVIAAQGIAQLVQLKKNEVADRVRLSQPPPPKVV